MIEKNYTCFIIAILLMIFIQKVHATFEKEIQNLKNFEKKVNLLQKKFNKTKDMNLIELMELEHDEILTFKKHCISVDQTLNDEISYFLCNTLYKAIETKIQQSELVLNDSSVSENKFLENAEIIFSIPDFQIFLKNNPFFFNFAHPTQILNFILQLQKCLEKIETNWDANEISLFFSQRIEFKVIYMENVTKIEKIQTTLKFKIFTYQLLLKNNTPVNDFEVKKMRVILARDFLELDLFLEHFIQLYEKFPLLQKQILEIKDSKLFMGFHYLPLYFWHRAKPLLFIHRFSTKNIHEIKI